MKALLESTSRGYSLSQYPRLETIEVFTEGRGTVIEKLNENVWKDSEEVIKRLSIVLMMGAVPKLRKLNLSGNYVNSPEVNGATSLLCALRYGACPNLEELDLSGNYLGDLGATEIATLLSSRVCRNLRKVDLSKNFIAQRGVMTLARVLSHGVCPDLELLNLSSNVVGDLACTVLYQAVAGGKLEKLRCLDLEDNFIGAHGLHWINRTKEESSSHSDLQIKTADTEGIILERFYSGHIDFALPPLASVGTA